MPVKRGRAPGYARAGRLFCTQTLRRFAAKFGKKIVGAPYLFANSVL